MKKKFDRMIKLFFAIAMIFSQMYSPLSVFAETINDTSSGDIAGDSDVMSDDTDATTYVTDDTNPSDDTSLGDNDNNDDSSSEDNADDNTDDNNGDNTGDTTSDDNDNTDEPNTDTGDPNSNTGNDGENTGSEGENTDDEIATLDIIVDGNVELVSSSEKTYDYNLLTDGNLNVRFNPVISNSDSNKVDLVINDEYTITDDFSFDFAKLAGGTYKFVFNLYEEDEVVDTVVVNVNYDVDTDDSYYTVNQGTTLEELVYKFISATLDDSADTKKMLSDYLTMNCDSDIWFDSEENIMGVRYGSTKNNVTTIGDIVSDISNTLGVLPESSEDDDKSIYTGLEIKVTFMGEEVTYTTVALGDTDGDTVTENDVQNIIDFSLENKELDPYGAKASDVNEDSIVNILDVTNVIKGINTDSFEPSENNEDEYSIDLVSENTVKVGDTIVVSFNVSGFDKGSLNGVEGELGYDDSVLQITGVNSEVFEFGTLNKDNKRFMYAGFEAIDSDCTVITFTFKALSAGDTTVSVDGVMLALDGTGLNLGYNNASTDITVIDDESNDDSSSDSTNNSTSNDKSNEVANKVQNMVNYVVEYVTYSGDSLIEDLIIKGYELDFDPNTFEYTINVGSKVNSLDITAILSDPNATYEVFGNGNFKAGENTVTVVVTAEDGTKTTYTLKVNKEKAKEKVVDEKDKDNNLVKTIVIILIILVIIGLVYLIFKDDEDNDEYSPKNKGSSKK